MIEAIKHKDVFSNIDPEIEKRRSIIVWTNTLWVNREWVAKHIWKYLEPSFRDLWYASLWDVHTRSGKNWDVYHWIVVSEKDEKWNNDWTNSDQHLFDWLENIYAWEMKALWEQWARLSELDNNRELSYLKIDAVKKDVQAKVDEIQSPHRIVHIGTWVSGMKWNTETQAMLEAMKSSQLRLHLYLYHPDIADHVENVVMMYRSLDLRPQIEEMRLAA